MSGQKEYAVQWWARDLAAYNKPRKISVLSVHDQVINLRVEGWRHLLMVAAPFTWRGPATIGLTRESFHDLKMVAYPGLKGSFEPGIVRFSENSKASICLCAGKDISFAPGVLPAVDTAALRAVLPEVKASLLAAAGDTASSVLIGGSSGEGFFRERIAETFPGLLRSLAAGDRAGFNSACVGLAGLGRGSTPSGDDLVFGAFLTYRYFMQSMGQCWQPPHLPPEARAGTSLLGAHMLEMGRKGLAPEPVRYFLAGLIGGENNAFILSRIIMLGASTGFDIAHAVLATLEHLINLLIGAEA
ncbi:MAG TPA: hypothetical protein DCQ14_00765 [Firmicutes bacterium]|nr:hypothetical protein [Bacillota bacterium]